VKAEAESIGSILATPGRSIGAAGESIGSDPSWGRWKRPAGMGDRSDRSPGGRGGRGRLGSEMIQFKFQTTDPCISDKEAGYFRPYVVIDGCRDFP